MMIRKKSSVTASRTANLAQQCVFWTDSHQNQLM